MNSSIRSAPSAAVIGATLIVATAFVAGCGGREPAHGSAGEVAGAHVAPPGTAPTPHAASSDMVDPVPTGQELPASDTTGTDSTSARAAADVVRRYYSAIAARDYRTAYALWGNAGESSGQTYAEFAAGFGSTARVEVRVGEPGAVEGAAGSRYAEVPVEVRAVTGDGERQRFEGSYTLRRAVVDGATPAQRRWHIYTASMKRMP